jgi:hypothetical protein
MDEMLMKVENIPTYTNKELNRATVKIIRLGEKVRKAAFETAAVMASVDASECYKDDGFKSVHEWAMTTFGFKKSASYSLLKIGKEYTRQKLNAKGKPDGYEDNLLPEGSVDGFNTTQVEKMLPLGHAAAAELVEGGEIIPQMSAKKIGQYVKDYLSAEDDDEADNEAEVVEGEVVDDSSEVVEVWDKAGVLYEIPADILKKYRVD